MAICTVLATMLALVSAAGFGARTASASPLYSVPTTSVMIPAGASVQFQVRGMALQPGAVLPQGTLQLAAQPAPADNVKIALFYGIDWGYTEANPEQSALAVWYMQDSQWHGPSHADAERIVSAAAAAPGVPSWSPSGQSLVQLAAQGRISLSQLALTPSPAFGSMGAGVLTVTNTTGQDWLAYLPYGTVFSGTGSPVLVWAVSANAGGPPPTAPALTATPAATETTQPTQQPTSTTTTGGGYKPGYQTATPPASPTNAGQKPVPTTSPTVGPKAEPPSATAVPTSTPGITPSDTPSPTATPVPSNTPTLAPTDSATPLPPTTAVKPQPQATASVAAPDGQVGEKVGQASASQGGSKPGANNDNVKAATSSPKNTGSDSKQAAVPVPGAGKQEPATDAASTGVHIDAAPPIPLTAVATQSRASSNNDVPKAVGTAGSAAPPAVPPAQGTRVSTPVTNPGAPPAVQTTYPTVAIAPPVPSAPVLGSPTAPPVKTAPPTPTAATGNADTGPIPPVQVTKLPQIQPSPVPVVPSPGPIIVTTDGNPTTDGGGAGGTTTGGDTKPQPTANPGNGGGTTTQPSTGTKPETSPHTGGGPSSLPMWLSVSSALLVLCGWQLRRLGAMQNSAPLETASGDTV